MAVEQGDIGRWALRPRQAAGRTARRLRLQTAVAPLGPVDGSDIHAW